MRREYFRIPPEMRKDSNMQHILVHDNLVISMAIAFRLKLQEPALLADERKDAALTDTEEPGDLSWIEHQQEDPALTDNEKLNDEPALFDDEKVSCRTITHKKDHQSTILYIR